MGFDYPRTGSLSGILADGAASGGRGLLLFLLLVQDRLEAPGQQRLYLCDRSGRRQMFEEVIQIRVRLDAIDAARHHEGEEVRARLGAARVVAEEPGFSSGRKMFDLLFAVVVVDRNLRVIQMPDELWPLPKRVAERFAERTLWRCLFR